MKITNGNATINIDNNGIIIKNNKSEEIVFNANTDGTLTLTGIINAKEGGEIGGLKITEDSLETDYFSITTNTREGDEDLTTSINIWSNDKDNPNTTIDINGIKCYNVNSNQISTETINAEYSVTTDTLTAKTIVVTDSVNINQIELGNCILSAGKETSVEQEIKFTASRDNNQKIIHVTSNEPCPAPVTLTIYYKLATLGIHTGWISAEVTIPKGGTSVDHDTKAFAYCDHIGFEQNNGNRYEATTKKTFTQYLDKYISCSGSFVPNEDDKFTLGSPRGRWKDIYVATGEINGSDKNIKNNIKDIPKEYSILFDNLNPVIYKLNNGDSGRFHLGLIAQELKSAIELSGLTTQDVAAYCEWQTQEGISCGIRYSELIPLNIYEIQALKKKIKILEDSITQLKELIK